jgi:hypothetical protein
VSVSEPSGCAEERDLRDERPELRGATPPSARAGSREEVGEGMGMDLPAGAHMAATRKSFACTRVRARNGRELGRGRGNRPSWRFLFFSFVFLLLFSISIHGF